MANQGEYNINFKSFSDNSSNRDASKALGVDVTDVNKTIESSLNTAFKSLESSIVNAIVGALKKVVPIGEGGAQISTEVLNKIVGTISSDVKATMADKINNRTTSNPLNKLDTAGLEGVMKDAISSTLTQQLTGLVAKINKSSGSSVDTQSVVREISSGMPVKEAAELSKAVQELALSAKSIADVPKVIADLKGAFADIFKSMFSLKSTSVGVSVDGGNSDEQLSKITNKSRKAKVKVVVDDGDVKKAESTLDSISAKPIDLSIDLDKSSIPVILKRIDEIRAAVSGGISLGIDMSAVDTLEKRIVELVNNFDRLKAGVFTELKNTQQSANNPNNSPEQRQKAADRAPIIETRWKVLNDVMDRTPEARGKRSKDGNLNPRADIITETAKPLSAFKSQLSSETLLNIAKSGGFRDTHSAAINETAIVEKLITSLNTSLSNLAADPSDAFNALTTALEKNTATQQTVAKAITTPVISKDKIAAPTSSYKAESATLSDSRSMVATMIKRYAGVDIMPNTNYVPKDPLRSSFDTEIYDNMNKLSKSLDELQQHIYSTVAKGLETKYTDTRKHVDWRVVENEGQGPRHNKAFNLKDRQWSMEVVDVNKLKSLTGKDDGTPKQLLNSYIEKLSAQKFSDNTHEGMSTEIASWLKANVKNNTVGSLSSEVKKAFGSDLLAKLTDAITPDTPSENIAGNFKDVSRSSLQNIYAQTAGASKISKELLEVKRTIAIPATKITTKGDPMIETTWGGNRSAMQTANYKTGHERAFDVYLQQQLTTANSQTTPANKTAYISKLGPELLEVSKAVRTFNFASTKEQDNVPGSSKTYEDISQSLVKSLAGKDDKASIANIYKQAVIPMSIEKERLTKSTSSPIKARDEADNLNAAIDDIQKQSADSASFMSSMYKKGMSSTQVVKSLDTIDFSNMYDTMGKAITPNLEAIVANISTSTGAVTDLGRVLTRLQGLMPTVDPSSPRRGSHQGSTVTTMFNTSKAYDLNKGATKDLLPKDILGEYEKSLGEENSNASLDTQGKKDFITSFNKRAKDLFYEAQSLSKQPSDDPYVAHRKSLLNTGSHKQLTSLGLTESTASNLSEADSAFNITGKTLPMYTGNLREASPFGSQFQQTGRNISNVGSAKGYHPETFGAANVPQEFPTLRSNTEQSIINAGRYGETGYGYNALTELGHTSGNFEDQILVSGKLAEAVTSTVKKLVRPTDTTGSGKTTRMKPGVLKDSDIEKADKAIMSIMGVTENYEGRADKVKLEDVRNQITVNKGETLEVQTAKLSELFLNHYGRKLTTRFGSKGVSVTPTKAATLGNLLSAYKGDEFKGVKVLTGDEQQKAGLGVAMMPKSMGEMASEILESFAQEKKGVNKTKITKATGVKFDDLSSKLKTSGNKFLLDIFTDEKRGLVTDSEAATNKMVFEQVQKAFKVMGTDLGQNKLGINQIKSLHKGEKNIARPIDVRLSSYGAAKRGLQTESLELITNNLAGTSGKESTVINDAMGEEHLPKLLGKGQNPGLFSEYSKELGFSRTKNTDEELQKKIEALYSTADKKKKSVQEEIKALVDLEKRSSYYVDIVDEMGKNRKGLVGNKFLSIIENPTQNEEWSEGDIQSLNKGEQLNIPAYAAYTSIFGEDSAFMKSVNETFTSKQAEHYDHILTYLVNTDPQYKANFLEKLNTVNVKDLKSVPKSSTNTLDSKDPNNLLGSIFDTDKFPSSFKASIPSTVGPNAPRDELYIPRSISRSTYKDPLTAGGHGVKAPGNKLQDVIDKSRSLDAFYNKDSSLLLDSDVKSMASAFGPRVYTELQSKFTSGGKDRADVSPAILEGAKKSMLSVLDKLALKPGVISEDPGTLDKDIIKHYNRKIDDTHKYNVAPEEASQKSFYSHLKAGGVETDTSLNAMKNLLTGVGGDKKDMSILARATDRTTRLDVMEGISGALGNARLPYEAGEQGSTPDKRYDDQVKQRQDKLTNSKKEYVDALQGTLLGKKGAIAGTMFTRNIPTVYATATNASVDKVEDLQNFKKALEETAGESFSKDLFDKLDSLTSSHAANVAKHKDLGMPVLKQHELGISEKYAEKLKTTFVKKYDEKTAMPLGESKEVKGSLKDLITYAGTLKDTTTKYSDPAGKADILKYIDSELTPYVESVRFPFTGTSSVKPYKAKLMSSENGIADDVLQVPGVPEMNMGAFKDVFNTVKDRVATLSSKREDYRVQGKDTEADALTVTIDKLNKAMSDVLPKYVAHAQKLDFDGDKIEVHSAESIKAREDIAKHFKVLTTDKDSTAGKFSDYYAADAEQPTQGSNPLAFAAKAFSKKFGSKDFSFLEKPFSTENLGYLSNKEKIGVLAGKEQDVSGVSDLEAVNKVMQELYSKIGAEFSNITGIDDLSAASEKAAQMLEDLTTKKPETGNLLGGHLKETLENTKLGTSVNAQLFKINTGTDTEGMTRLMRAFETKMGFGGGDISLHEKTSDGSISQDSMTRERNTQLNEFFRFAIQKGMDVKHAGERPIAGELIKGVTSGPEALNELISNINTKDSYKDLKKFKNINEDSLRNNFGKFSTSDLRDQAKSIGMTHADSLERPELTDTLVKSLGFDGFLKDLQRTIESMALNTLAANPKNTNPVAALQKLYKPDAEGRRPGISVSSLITEKQDPLYKYRTNSFTPTNDFAKEFAADLRKGIPEASSKQGAYSEMVRGFANLNKTKVDPNLVKSVSSEMSTYSNEDFGSGKAPIIELSRKIGAMEDRLGLAPLSDNKKVELRSSEEYLTNSQKVIEGDTPEDIASKEKYNDKLVQSMLLKSRLSRVDANNPDAGQFASKTSEDGLLKHKASSTSSFAINDAVDAYLGNTNTGSGGNGDINSAVGTMSGGSGNFSHQATLSGSTPIHVIIDDILKTSIVFPVKLVEQVIASGNQSGVTTFNDNGLTPEEAGFPSYGAASNIYKHKSEGAANPTNPADDVDKFLKTESYRKEAASRGMSYEPFPGTGPEAKFQNLGLLRSNAKMLFASEGKDFDMLMHKMPKRKTPQDSLGAGDYIENAKTEGSASVKDFLRYTQDMRVLNRQDDTQGMSGGDIASAWKLYKDAVIEFLMNKAQKAKDIYDAALKSGSNNDIIVANNNFSSAVNAVIKKIQDDTSKASDIYTSNNVWKAPELAKAAGVYMTPSEIQKKSSRDLGDDTDPDSKLLRGVFDNLTKDLSGKSRGDMTAPVDKARMAVKELTNMKPEMLDMMANGELLERLGPKVAEAWDFEGAVSRITRMREALELFKKSNVSDNPLSVERKNIDSTIKYLKDAENKFSKVNMKSTTDVNGMGSWGKTGVVAIPKWESPENQLNMNKRNLAKLREYYSRSEDKGGAKVGDYYNYDSKVFDDSGKAVQNNVVTFHKYGEAINSAGEKIGVFNEKQQDMIATMSGADKGFTSAIRRAVLWGTASTIVYGGVSKLKESLDTMVEIESSMAQIKMVVPTASKEDMAGLEKSAVGFAKDYGLKITDVLEHMKTFAQQGLETPEITERSKTAAIATNITTMTPKQAPEAITAAMKIYGNPGDSSIKFLDAWSEVETKSAVTAQDLADGLKKSASAAKAAGVSFHQLNGIIASVGSVTRQSGKEVGTSLRFIMRRLSAEKGPKELAKLNIPTVTGVGDLRGGFDVLDDLASKWDKISNAQKMAVAQALGGTRQYNTVIALMDNWKEALSGVENSMNSNGAAVRKNKVVMETYEKQVLQTKAAFLELQLSVGKVAFPVAKAGLDGMKMLAETMTGIPTAFKVAGVAALTFFTYLSKGAAILDTISNFFSTGSPVMGGLLSSVKNELKTASFEVMGAGQTDRTAKNSTEGLKTLIAGQVPGVSQGKSMRDFSSAIGKTTYLLMSAGKSFNDTVGGAMSGTGEKGQAAGQKMVRGSSWLSSVVAASGGRSYGKGGNENLTFGDLAKGTASKFGTPANAEASLTAGGLKKFGLGAAAVASEVAGLGTAAGGILVDKISEKLGAGGNIFKSWAKDNTGIVQAIAPMLLTIGLLAPQLTKLGAAFKETTQSSEDFEQSMFSVKLLDENALKQTRDLSRGLRDIGKGFEGATADSTPEVTADKQRLGTYRSPIFEMVDVQKDASKFGTDVANSNIGLIAGYDKLGNVVLKASDNFKTLFSTFEKSKIKDIAETNVKIASKHAEALTKTDGSEKWKKELKDLTKEMPMVGDLVSDQIKLSPAKNIEILTGGLNKLIAKKSSAPLSTIYDEDIKKLQAKLTKTRSEFEEVYSSFKSSLSSISTTGLNKDEISRILGADGLKAGYKLMVDVEPRFNVAATKGKVQWQDVMGAEVMKKLFPENTALDATKELSAAKSDTAGLGRRDGKVLSGDLVTFTDGVTDKFNMSGKQAIVKLKETSDGIFNWVATYFNTKTLKVEEHTFDSGMQDLVDSVLPSKAIEQDLSDRIESLSTFITGASAGLMGTSKKAFKLDFNLGERFFSDIATSTIIQGDKGFKPQTNDFGDSPFQKGWADDFSKYYAKPMQEYKALVEQLDKMHLGGLDAGSVDMSTGLYDSIVKLQEVLRNNQIVLQYRAVFADLTKTMDLNSRAIEENIAVESSRMSLTKETSGLMQGKNIGLANIDFGKNNEKDLTSQERLLKNDPRFEAGSKQLKTLEIRKAGTAEQIYSTDKAKTALASIKNLSTGFGSALSGDDLKKYTDIVAKTGDAGIAELKLDTSKTAENTAATVDKLDQILENFKDPKGVKSMSSSFMDSLDFVPPSLNITKPERLNEALDRVASVRDKAVSSGDSDTIIKANRTLDTLTKQLVDKLGVKGAADRADSGLFGSGAFKGSELIQRAFSGLDFKSLSKEMKANMPDESSWFGLSKKNGTPKFDESVNDVLQTQDNNKAKASESKLLSSKNLAAASTGFGVYTAFNTNFTNKKIKGYEDQLTTMQANGASPDEIKSVTAAKTEEEKKARMYGTMRYAAGGASGAMLLARNLGVSDKNISRLGVGGAAIGAYSAAKMQSGMTGEDMPDIVKDFGKEVSIFTDTMKNADGGLVDKVFKQRPGMNRFKKASGEFMRKFAEESQGLQETPRETDSDRAQEYDKSSASWQKVKDDATSSMSDKAKEWKNKVENPSDNLREDTKNSTNETINDLKNKVNEFRDHVKNSTKESIQAAAVKMATGERVDLKGEAQQVYEGAKVKGQETFDYAKDKVSSTTDTLKAAGAYSKEAVLGVLDALREALSKNTEATTDNTSARENGHALGGYIQKFATGGTVKQIMPGEGDNQLSLLTAGEEVLSKDQRRKFGPIINALKTARPTVMGGPDDKQLEDLFGVKVPVMHADGGSVGIVGDPEEGQKRLAKMLGIPGLFDAGKMYASGGSVGIVDPSNDPGLDSLRKILSTSGVPEQYLPNGGVTKNLVDPNMSDYTGKPLEGTADLVKDIANIDDTKIKTNMGKVALVGTAALGTGMYAYKGSASSGKGFSDTILGARDKAKSAYDNFNMSDKFLGMDKTLFASPLGKFNELKEGVMGLKGLSGKGFITGAKMAGKVGLKAAGLLGTAVTAAFAVHRLAKGDFAGAGLEALSAALSSTGLGSVGSLAIQGYLAKRDSDIIEESDNPIPEYAGGGLIGNLFSIAGNVLGLGVKGAVGTVRGGIKGAELLGKGAKNTYDFYKDNKDVIDKYAGYAGIGASKSGKGLWSATKSVGRGIDTGVDYVGKGLDSINDFSKTSTLNKNIVQGASSAALLGAGYGMYEKEPKYAAGGYTTGMIQGEGTGTSDSITMPDVPGGSFIIPSKYANKAKAMIEAGRRYAKGGATDTSDIRVSNGEYFIDQEDASKIGKDNLEKLRYGKQPSFAGGGVLKGFQDGGAPQASTASAESTIAIDQDSINRFAQAAAAASAFTFSRYASEKSADKTRSADLDKLSQGENQDIYKVLRSNPEAIQKVYDNLNQSPTDAKKAKESTADTEEVSSALDTNKEYAKVIKDIDTVTADLNKSYEKQAEDISKLKEKLYTLEIAEKFKMQIEAMNRTISDANFAESVQRSLKVGTGAFTGLTRSREVGLDRSGITGLDSMQLLQLSKKRKKDDTDWWDPRDFDKAFVDPLKNSVKRGLNYFNPMDSLKYQYSGQDVLNKYTGLEDKKNNAMSNISVATQNKAQDPANTEKWNKVIADNAVIAEKATKHMSELGVAVTKLLVGVEKARSVFTQLENTLNATDSIELNAQHSFENQGMSGKTKGAITGMSFLPNAPQDLSSQQYAWTQSSDSMKNRIGKYRFDSSQRDVLLAEQSTLSKKGRSLETTRLQTNDSSFWRTSTEMSKVLEEKAANSKALTKNTEDLRKNAEALQANSLVIQNFVSMTDASKQLEASLQGVKAVMYDASTGARAIQKKLGNLYGGSGQDAPQFVDINQRQDLARYGSDVQSGKSTVWDLKKAELNKTLNTSSSPEEIYTAQNALYNLPQAKKEAEEHENKLKAQEETKANIEPYINYTKDISIQRTRIKQQLEMGTNTPEQTTYLQNSAASLDHLKGVINSVIGDVLDKARQNGGSKAENLTTVQEDRINLSKKNTAGIISEGSDDKKYAVGSNPLLSEASNQTQIQQAMCTYLSSIDSKIKDSQKTLGVDIKEHLLQYIPDALKVPAKPIEDGENYGAFAGGGQIGTSIKGPGTGTSDDISMMVPSGSYVIQSKYANQAKNYVNSFANGGQVPINISNGEFLLNPQEVSAIGGVRAAAALNAGKGFAKGGDVQKEADAKELAELLAMVRPSEDTPAATEAPKASDVKALVGKAVLGGETTNNLSEKQKALKEVMGSFASGGNVQKEADAKELAELLAMIRPSEDTPAPAEAPKANDVKTLVGKAVLGSEVTNNLSEKQKALKEVMGYAFGGNVGRLSIETDDKETFDKLMGKDNTQHTNNSVSGGLSIQSNDKDTFNKLTGKDNTRYANNGMTKDGLMIQSDDKDAFNKLMGKDTNSYSYRGMTSEGLSIQTNDMGTLKRSGVGTSTNSGNTLSDIAKSYINTIKEGDTVRGTSKEIGTTTYINPPVDTAKANKVITTDSQLSKSKAKDADRDYFVKPLSRNTLSSKRDPVVMGSRGLVSEKSLPKVNDYFDDMRREMQVFKTTDDSVIAAYLKRGDSTNSWEGLSADEKGAKIAEFRTNMAPDIEKVTKNLDTLQKYGGVAGVLRDGSMQLDKLGAQTEQIYRSRLSVNQRGLSYDSSKQDYIAKNGEDAWKAAQGLNGPSGLFNAKRYNYSTRLLDSPNAATPTRESEEAQLKAYDALKEQYKYPDSYKRTFIELIRSGRTAEQAAQMLKNGSGFNANNGSNQVKHTGGITGSTGNYFLEKGELVVSKNFKNGGYALSDNLPSYGNESLSSSSTGSSLKGLDTLSDVIKRFEETMSSLKDIKIEGLDKLTDIKIEGLDKLSDIKIEGLDQLKNIQIDGLDKLTNIQIEGLDNLQNIKIEGLSELRDIKILGIEDLKDINVNKGSVGADSGDALASTLKDFDSRIMNVEESFDSKFELIDTKIKESIGDLPNMKMQQDSDIAEIRRELVTTVSEISTVDSTIKRFKQEIDSVLTDLNAKSNTILTHLYSIKRT